MSERGRHAVGLGSLHARLLFGFVAGAVLVAAMQAVYWWTALEPRLYQDADSNAGVLAQAYSVTLADALTQAARPDEGLYRLSDAIDDLLVVRDPYTGEPFILGIEVRADGEALGGEPGVLDLVRGARVCEACFVKRVPLQSKLTHEVIGEATFFSNRAFFDRLSNEVRVKLWVSTGLIVLALALVWSFLVGVFKRLQESEEAASAAVDAKGRFLAAMSDELRTPVNGILGMVRLLRRSEPTEPQREYLNAIGSSGKTLLRILDDILDISRIEAGRLDFERVPVRLDLLLEEVVRLMEPRASEKWLSLRLEIGPDVPVRLRSDPARLRQVLFTLVGNALKYTDEGGIILRAQRQASEGDRVRVLFEVRDTGSGIPAVELRQLFESLSSAAFGLRRVGRGNGLGLMMCKRLVEAMGGSIGVESREGSGSRFFFSLPLETLESAAFEEEVAAEQSLWGRSLAFLLVEDGDINRKVARTLLQREGHEVVEVVDGRAAVDAAGERRFDVVLMDLHMPEMDGFRATALIRALPDPERANVPIVAFTANIMPEEAHRCLDAGMDGVVLKPFEADKLRTEVLRAIAQRRGGRLESVPAGA